MDQGVVTTIRRLLEQKGWDSSVRFYKSLSGGVSNKVFLLETDSRRFVFKQALERLLVKDEWVADRSRILREVDCLRWVRRLTGPQWAPQVYEVWPEEFAFAMEAGPEPGRTWKDDLLQGKLNPRLTEQVASLMALIHSESANNEEVRQTFGDLSNFVQLRTDPYFVTIAQRHGDLEEKILSALPPLFEGHCLVHGDFSPKNLLLLPDGRVWLLDCEVAHFGNPAFDLAFCTSHLLLKSLHLGSPLVLAEAKRLWTSYWRLVKPFPRAEWEPIAVRTLSLLLLARIDGKSPVEYLSEEKRQAVRTLARSLISARVDRFDRLVREVKKWLET